MAKIDFHVMRGRLVRAGALVLCGAATLVACQSAIEDPLGGANVAGAESVASSTEALTYTQDFFDDFTSPSTSLNTANWQDQILWVNNEYQCYDNTYNESGGHKTLEVSGGTLKLRVVDSGTVSPCNNYDKNGVKHGDTRYKGGRIASKNRKEFAQGKWTARLKMYTWTTSNTTGQASGLSGMFPAWWILGSRNNEAPVQESNENVCWPLAGSGEIDIMEHSGSSGQNRWAARGIKNLGSCNNGDWQTYQVSPSSDLSNFHEYQMENTGADLIYRVDNVEVARNSGIGGNYTETFFAILNYALRGANMAAGYKEYAMEIDWVKHESASSCTPTTCAAQGKNCGSLSDGCGGTLSCGSCTSPATCGGGGTANVCGGGSGSCSPTISAYTLGKCNATVVYGGKLYKCISQASGVNGSTQCGTAGVYCSGITPTDAAWGMTAWQFVQNCP